MVKISIKRFQIKFEDSVRNLRKIRQVQFEIYRIKKCTLSFATEFIVMLIYEFFFFRGEHFSGGEDAVYRRLVYKERKPCPFDSQARL